MQLTDPRDLLSQVSVERYQNLLASCRRRKAEPRLRFGKPSHGRAVKSAASALSVMPPVVEPYLSVRSTAAPEMEKASQDQEKEHMGSVEETIIRSRVSALGDFVDTDAVSCQDSLSPSSIAPRVMAYRLSSRLSLPRSLWRVRPMFCLAVIALS